MKEKKEEEMYKDERWLPVVGYEGWYDVSDFGRVKRVRAACGTQAGRILKPSITQGYEHVDLHKKGKDKTMRVHKLVAVAFIGTCPDGVEVNHIDGDKTNNCLNNLEYVTPSENRRHAFRIGLQSFRGENNNSSKLTEENVHEIRKVYGKEPLESIATRFGVSQQTIGDIINGRSWASLKEEGEE